MLTGWYAIHRELLSSDIWLNEPFTRGQAWVDLLGLARFKPGHVRIGPTRIDLARGQLAWSQKSLGERWRWDRSKVRRFLKELERDQRIEQRTSRLTTVITVVNYDRYQSPEPRAPQPIPQATPQPGDSPRRTKEQRQPRQHRQHPRPGWEGVEETLRKLGVAAARQTAAAADAAGLSLDEAREIIDHYEQRPGAYGPGALVARLDGRLAAWPPPSEQFARAERRQKQRAEQARQSLQQQRRRDEAQANRQREQALEKRLGPVLDGLDDHRRQQLELAAVPDEQERQISQACPTLHRQRLLETLGQRLKLSAA
jgi:DNA-binding transcriptional MerR regulator